MLDKMEPGLDTSKQILTNQWLEAPRCKQRQLDTSIRPA